MSIGIGAIVSYTLDETDAERINTRRADTTRYRDEHQRQATGVMVHVGNLVRAGDVYPMMITRRWGATLDSAVNGTVFLDGTDTL